MNKRYLAVLVMIVCFCSLNFVSIGLVKNEDKASPKVSTINSLENWKNYGEYFNLFMKFIKSKYKDEISEEKLLEGAFKGMLSNLDNYSEFFTVEEANDFRTSIEGNYSGIGAVITKADNGNILIQKVFDDSPAMMAGIMDGDSIISVEGIMAKDKEAKEVSNLIRGISGTKIMIKYERGKTQREVLLTRGSVLVNPVRYKIVGDIGYIKLDVFNLNSSSQMNSALAFIDKNKIKKIILDLRDNPGGEVSQAVNIAKRFVPSGIITKLKFTSNLEKDEEYYSDLIEPKYNLAILINKDSASASEILAGAVQDKKAGKLIGTKSYGKSMVQKMYPITKNDAMLDLGNIGDLSSVDAFRLPKSLSEKEFEDKIFGWIKITMGEYFTPNGRRIDKKGIDPDILVEASEKDEIDIVSTVNFLSETGKYFLGDEGPEVVIIEKILKLAKYDVDYPDSYYDEKTVEAIKKFQANKGLYSYGKTDFITKSLLNKTLLQIFLEKDSQYAKAIETLKN